MDVVSDFVTTTILWETLATQDALDRLRSLRALELFPGDPAWLNAMEDVERSLLAILQGGRPRFGALLRALEELE